MTVLSSTNKTIQSGNGSNKNFDFSFKVPLGIDSDYEYLSLTKRNSDGSETAITTNFSVTGLGEDAGGTLTYPVSGTALTSQEKIIIRRIAPNKQREDFKNQGRYSLEDIEDAIDNCVFITQQLQEQIDRCVQLNITSSQTDNKIADFVAGALLYVAEDGESIAMSSVNFGSISEDLNALVAIADEIVAVAAIDDEVAVVAGIDTEVTTVSGIAADVSAVAAIDSDVTQVSSIHAAVSTVSGISGNVTTVAGISAAVTTVAGISSAVSNVSSISSAVSNVSSISAAVSAVSSIAANVSTVAGISANVTSVAGNATNINTVAGLAANINTLAAISANITTVAGISANVTTVAGMSASIASVVANMTSIQNAASFGFPTLASGDEYKMLQINAARTGYTAVEASSRKNAIINGCLRVWQRGTSFTSVADQTYLADRFQYVKSGTMVHDITQSTDVPSFALAGRIFPYSMKIDCQTVDSSIASGDYCAINHTVEGHNYAPLAQKTNTKTIYIKSSKAGTMCIAFRNSGNDRSLVNEITIGAGEVNTWVKRIVNLPASPSAGTWDYTTGVGVLMSIVLAAGSAIQTTAGTWQTGLYIGSANQTNFCDSTSNDIYICGLQLEKGDLPTPFESRSIQEEIYLCQRYARVIGGDNLFQIFGWGFARATTLGDINIPLHQPMRIKPSITTSGNFQMSDGVTGTATTGIALLNSTQKDVACLDVTVASGLTQYRAYRLEAANSLATKITLSSEF